MRVGPLVGDESQESFIMFFFFQQHYKGLRDINIKEQHIIPYWHLDKLVISLACPYPQIRRLAFYDFDDICTQLRTNDSNVNMPQRPWSSPKMGRRRCPGHDRPGMFHDGETPKR